MKCGLAFKMYPHWSVRDLKEQINAARRAIHTHLIRKGYVAAPDHRINITFTNENQHTRVVMTYEFSDEDTLDNCSDFHAVTLDEVINIGEPKGDDQ